MSLEISLNEVMKMGVDLAIARGLLNGITHINKFGHAHAGIQTTLTDLWDRADAAATQQIWVAPTQARIHAIVSTSNNDSDTGGSNPQSDGARILRIFGLTSWNTVEEFEDIVLDGTQAVNTVKAYVIIYRMFVLTKGGNTSGPNVGIITATAASDATITAQIHVMDGQTQMAIYGIPSVQTAYMTNYYAGISKAQGAVVSLDAMILYNPEPDVELKNFLIKHVIGMQSTGAGNVNHPYNPYKVFKGPGILKLQAIASAADTEASGGFDLILIKKALGTQ